MADVAPLGRVEMVPIGSVRPAKGNPRRIPDQAVEVVAQSLLKFGWQQPLVVDAAGELIVGHTRHRAALKLKQTVVPVVRAEALTPEQVRAYRIADNRTADFTSWDFPELARELEAIGDDYADVLALADWDQIMSGFEEITAAVTESDARIGEVAAAGFDMVVTFPTKEQALRAADALFGMGATDVRHKLR